MRVHVLAECPSNSAQAHAYAEYRVFSALSSYGPLVRGAQVVLRYDGDDEPRAFKCQMTVSLEPAGVLRASVRASYACAAIDQAAGRIGQLIRRRAARPDCSDGR